MRYSSEHPWDGWYDGLTLEDWRYEQVAARTGLKVAKKTSTTSHRLNINPHTNQQVDCLFYYYY